MHAQRRHPSPPLSVPSGYGSVVGLVSLGQVGRRVAERLGDLEITVLAHDPFAPESLFSELDLEPVSLEDLFARSDIVSLHTPLLPTTTGMVNTRLLSRLKPGATLINTARGGLIHEPDLITFLRARPDVQAVIDVTDPEPPVPDSPLYELPNLFLTPHIAGSIGPECRRMGRAMVEEFQRYVRGEPLCYMVNREQLARMA
jgi:phosphoglycerate dehydrogenase-like enzyme